MGQKGWANKSDFFVKNIGPLKYSVIGGITGAIGTYLHNKKSSAKTDKIISFQNELIEKSEKLIQVQNENQAKSDSIILLQNKETENHFNTTRK